MALRAVAVLDDRGAESLGLLLLADLDAAATVHIGENWAEQAIEATSAAAELVTLASRIEMLLKRLLLGVQVVVGLRATGSALVALLSGVTRRSFGRVDAVGAGAALRRAHALCGGDE